MSKKTVTARNRNAAGARTAKLICIYHPAQINCRTAKSESKPAEVQNCEQTRARGNREQETPLPGTTGGDPP